MDSTKEIIDNVLEKAKEAMDNDELLSDENPDVAKVKWLVEEEDPKELLFVICCFVWELGV